jgi:hypothetical protein
MNCSCPKLVAVEPAAECPSDTMREQLFWWKSLIDPSN